MHCIEFKSQVEAMQLAFVHHFRVQWENMSPTLLSQTHGLLTSWSFLIKACVGLALVVISIVRLALRSTKKGDCKLPPGPVGFPIIGNLLDLRGGVEMPERWRQMARERNWPIISFKFPNKLLFIVSSPEVVKEMLITKGNTFNSRDRYTYVGVNLGNDDKTGALFTPHGNAWKMTRKLMVAGQNEFKKSVGDQYIVDNILRQLYEEIDRETTVNARIRVAKMTVVRFILIFVFGPGAEQYADQIVPLNDELFRAVDKNSAIEFFIPIVGQQLSWAYYRYYRRGIIARKHHLYERIISERSIKYNQSKEWSLCDMVQEAEEKGEITHQQALQIYEECFFGGQDTTGEAIEGTLKLLAKNQEVLVKVQKEMDAMIGVGKQLRHLDVEKLPYFQAVVKEGLRLHRAVPVLTPHVAHEDATLGGYDIPKDTEITVNLWSLARDPDSFPDPFAVKPERFLERDTNFTGNDCRYIVFGVGHRICPGQTLALFMINMIVGSLAQRYTFSLPDDWKHERDSGTLFKEVALRLRLTRRDGFQ